MTLRITRHFVSVGARRVHYRRGGAGPALVLLHASACSSKVLVPLVERFGERFTVIALDTPGFGLSDKLALAQPSIEDFADALAGTLDALGIMHAAVYGRHTGASIAVEFAARHPARCAMALADGYAILAQAYDEARIAQYLQPIVPSWDGSHLVWLWFRYRDQHAFWPWNAQTIDARADTDIPDVEFLHRGVVEFLEAGNDYRLGYAAPFRHDALGVFPRLKVPVCFGARPGDWMHRMLPLYPSGAWVEEMPREADAAAARELEMLTRHPAREAPPAAPACAPLAGRSTTDYVEIGGTQMFVRVRGGEPARIARAPKLPIIVIAPTPGSSALCEPLLEAIAAQDPSRPVLAFDLPGLGESEPPADGEITVEGWAAALRAALDALGIARAHLFAQQGGGAVAVELARIEPQRIASLALDAPVVLDRAARRRLAPQYAPSLAPSWEGAHLLRAWHHLRDQELWWPWFDRRREAIRKHPPRIDPEALTARVREMIKQPHHYAKAWQTVLGYPLPERLAALGAPLRIIAGEHDVFAAGFDALSGLVRDVTCRRIDDTPAARAAALLEWMRTRGDA